MIILQRVFWLGRTLSIVTKGLEIVLTFFVIDRELEQKLDEWKTMMIVENRDPGALLPLPPRAQNSRCEICWLVTREREFSLRFSLNLSFSSWASFASAATLNFAPPLFFNISRDSATIRSPLHYSSYTSSQQVKNTLIFIKALSVKLILVKNTV